MAHTLQLDALEPHPHQPAFRQIRLYTDQRCQPAFMREIDYQQLMAYGFFLRNGDAPDSAGVLNTTYTYQDTGQDGARAQQTAYVQLALLKADTDGMQKLDLLVGKSSGFHWWCRLLMSYGDAAGLLADGFFPKLRSAWARPGEQCRTHLLTPTPDGQ